MENIDFDTLEKEITDILEKEETIILATSKDGKVTARTMCHVNDGLDIYFGTSNLSQKYMQISANPSIAFVSGGMQIEAVAAICGHPDENPEYKQIYAAKFPHLAGQYPPAKDDVVIKCTPVKISLYKYTGKPSWDILDLVKKSAYRL